MRIPTKILGLILCGVSIGTVSWFIFSGRTISASQSKVSKRPFLTKLPKIKSCVEHIKLVKAELEDWGGSQVLVLELENQAYVGVISISLEQLCDKSKDSVIESGFSPDKPPLIVIPPGEKKRVHIGNLEANSLIRIGSVMFSDGTEEGCESSLKEAREIKDRDIKKRGPQK